MGCQFGSRLPPPQKNPSATGTELTNNSVHPAKLNSMPAARGFRCGEDGEARRRPSAPAHQRMVQKNFFSLKGFSEAGTGMMRGSSRMCASQYAIRSAAALETWNVEDKVSWQRNRRSNCAFQECGKQDALSLDQWENLVLGHFSKRLLKGVDYISFFFFFNYSFYVFLFVSIKNNLETWPQGFSTKVETCRCLSCTITLFCNFFLHYF